MVANTGHANAHTRKMKIIFWKFPDPKNVPKIGKRHTKRFAMVHTSKIKQAFKQKQQHMHGSKKSKIHIQTSNAYISLETTPICTIQSLQ